MESVECGPTYERVGPNESRCIDVTIETGVNDMSITKWMIEEEGVIGGHKQ